MRCGQCHRRIAARWRRCPFCKRPSYAPSHPRYPFIDNRLDSFRAFSAGASLWWLAASLMLWFGAERPLLGATFCIVAIIAFVASLCAPLFLFAWLISELIWFATAAAMVALTAPTGWGLLLALAPFGAFAWMARQHRDVVARLTGRDPPPSEVDESRVPQRTPCVDCGSAYSTVIAPIYVVTVGRITFWRLGSFRSLCVRHAKQRAVPALIITALFGPLGIPWGVIRSWEAFQLNLDEGGVQLDSTVLRRMRKLEAENADDSGAHPFDVLVGLISGGMILATVAWRTNLFVR